MMPGPSRKTTVIATVASLAALHIVLSLFPGPAAFRRMSIALEPLEGIVAGPAAVFAAAMIGFIGGRFARPDAIFFENFFGVAEGIGALGAGLLLKRHQWSVVVIYGSLLGSFLLHPLARIVPLWTLWNTYLGFLAIFPAMLLARKLRVDKLNLRTLLPAITLIAFVSTELDVMVRIFMLTVAGLYQLYPIPVEALPAIFIAGAFQTPIEAIYSIAVSALIWVPVLIAIEKSRALQWPLT
jgi:hypothetical protein